MGNPSDGAAVAGINGYPAGLYTTPAVSYGPRFGFGYDVFGDGKTAIRGGFGVFKDKIQGNLTYNESGQAPVTIAPTIYYTTFATIAQGAAQGLINAVAGPSTTTQIYGMQPLPTVMNFNLGIQHQRAGMIFDVAYVGSLNRHLPLEINLNPIPIYSMLLPQNAGLTANFLRPYQGYADINSEQFVGDLKLQLAAGFGAAPLPRAACNSERRTPSRKPWVRPVRTPTKSAPISRRGRTITGR